MADANQGRVKAEKLKNPYDEYDAHPDEAHITPRFAWVVVIIFLLLMTVPPVWRNAFEVFSGDEGSVPLVNLFRYDASKGTFFEHLRAIESEIEDAAFTDPPRRAMQSVLVTVFREGNRKTLIGEHGWLFFKPALDGLTGYGPLKPEPNTVAKDPNRESWEGPLGAITRFAAQLDSYGVELVLVPIPVKPMIYPEELGAADTAKPLNHADAPAFYDKLREAKVQVLDLSDDLFAMKAEGQVFLKQDTHWTPAAMQLAAARVAEFLKARPWFAEVDSAGAFAEAEGFDITAPGDLVEKLDLPAGSRAFADETAQGVARVLGGGGDAVSIYDTASPVVLLGDSFTNIFSQGDMGWGEDAGFAQHLTRELGMTLDTIAQNGQASTGVRKTLASRPGAETAMREKKVVVWAIAARDLMLSETPAREALVRWDDVTFSTAAAATTEPEWPLTLKARLTMKSSFADPADVPYPDALYACEYEALDGDLKGQSFLVFHWAFRERKLLPSSKYQEGDEQVLTLRAFSEMTDLQSVNQANDSFDPDLQVLWAEQVAAPGTGTPATTVVDPPDAKVGVSAPGRRAGLVAGVYALALIGVFCVVARKRLRRLTQP